MALLALVTWWASSLVGLRVGVSGRQNGPDLAPPADPPPPGGTDPGLRYLLHSDDGVEVLPEPGDVGRVTFDGPSVDPVGVLPLRHHTTADLRHAPQPEAEVPRTGLAHERAPRPVEPPLHVLRQQRRGRVRPGTEPRTATPPS